MSVLSPRALCDWGTPDPSRLPFSWRLDADLADEPLTLAADSGKILRCDASAFLPFTSLVLPGGAPRSRVGLATPHPMYTFQKFHVPGSAFHFVSSYRTYAAGSVTPRWRAQASVTHTVAHTDTLNEQGEGQRVLTERCHDLNEGRDHVQEHKNDADTSLFEHETDAQHVDAKR